MNYEKVWTPQFGMSLVNPESHVGLRNVRDVIWWKMVRRKHPVCDICFNDIEPNRGFNAIYCKKCADDSKGVLLADYRKRKRDLKNKRGYKK